MKPIRLNIIAGCIAAVGLSAAWGYADTVYLKSGLQMSGKVSRPNDNCVAMDTGRARLTFEAAEVDRVETNDKSGDGAVVFTPAVILHEEHLQKETGMTSKQRQELLDLLQPLQSEDAEVRAKTRQQIIAKGRQLDIFDFLKYSLAGFSPQYVTEILQILMELNPGKGRAVVLELTESPVPEVRAKALALLAQDKGAAETLIQVARGMVDPAPQVRMVAAELLGILADKRSTPVLINGLSSTDKRMQNTCSGALSKIWSSNDLVVNFATANEWNEYWKEVGATVRSPISREMLTPLVAPDAHGATAFMNE